MRSAFIGFKMRIFRLCKLINRQADRWRDGQIYGPMDGLTDGPTDGLTDRPTNRPTVATKNYVIFIFVIIIFRCDYASL